MRSECGTQNRFVPGVALSLSRSLSLSLSLARALSLSLSRSLFLSGSELASVPSCTLLPHEGHTVSCWLRVAPRPLLLLLLLLVLLALLLGAVERERRVSDVAVLYTDSQR